MSPVPNVHAPTTGSTGEPPRDGDEPARDLFGVIPGFSQREFNEAKAAQRAQTEQSAAANGIDLEKWGAITAKTKERRERRSDIEAAEDRARQLRTNAQLRSVWLAELRRRKEGRQQQAGVERRPVRGLDRDRSVRSIRRTRDARTNVSGRRRSATSRSRSPSSSGDLPDADAPTWPPRWDGAVGRSAACKPGGRSVVVS